MSRFTKSNSLAVDPSDPNIIYAGTWHLPWKTEDGGKTWAIIKQGIIECTSDVFSIVVDPGWQRNEGYSSACVGYLQGATTAEQKNVTRC